MKLDLIHLFADGREGYICTGNTTRYLERGAVNVESDPSLPPAHLWSNTFGFLNVDEWAGLETARVQALTPDKVERGWSVSGEGDGTKIYKNGREAIFLDNGLAHIKTSLYYQADAAWFLLTGRIPGYG